MNIRERARERERAVSVRQQDDKQRRPRYVLVQTRDCVTTQADSHLARDGRDVSPERRQQQQQ